MKRDVTTDSINIESIKKEYEQPYAHKFNNLNEMDQSLEGHIVPKLTQEETDNLNRSISIKET